MNNFQIAPSILNADFLHLQDQIEAIKNADMVHVDVMDYHFVPNISFGGDIVQQIINTSKSYLKSDIHLMIADPDRWAIDYAKMGANSITFHRESVTAPIKLAREIRQLGKELGTGTKAAIAVRPIEPVEPLFDFLEEFDMILIMTVEPGFGGQKFLDIEMDKVRRLREKVQELPENKRPLIEVDGGVSLKTVETVAEAGANVAVAGSAVYKAGDSAAISKAVEDIRALGEKAFTAAWV
ncbi:MAG: ribulose-phosphate 3-epimerase [Candidatus Ancillula sp.]|jgi:ribulose-phosphate 3-epimerase|nr:ribulose-phosphate 3-epimerase [Candidatus Ancillula sp.]